MTPGLKSNANFRWLRSGVPRSLGLAPLSSAAAGWIMLHATLPQMFAGCGVVLVLCATLALLFTPMRRIVTA